MIRVSVTTGLSGDRCSEATSEIDCLARDMKGILNMDSRPRGSSMDRSSGFGRPTHPPSHHDCLMTVAFRVFVPITAAGQRGLFTPLPCIHL